MSKILVIDDDAGDLNIINHMLTDMAIEPVLCQNPLDALQTLKKTKDIDMVLLDLTMPGIDGRELLPKIQKEYSELPVVIVTSDKSAESAVALTKAGAENYT